MKESLGVYEPSTKFEGYNGVIPHLKVLIMTNDDWEINDDTLIYFGSHNFTASAWGRYEKGDTVLAVANTEIGVVFPSCPNSAEIKKQIVGDLPFRFPPRKFKSEEKPYFNDFFSSSAGAE